MQEHPPEKIPHLTWETLEGHIDTHSSVCYCYYFFLGRKPQYTARSTKTICSRHGKNFLSGTLFEPTAKIEWLTQRQFSLIHGHLVETMHDFLKSVFNSLGQFSPMEIPHGNHAWFWMSFFNLEVLPRGGWELKILHCTAGENSMD